MSDLDLICIWDHCSPIATCPICEAKARIKELEETAKTGVRCMEQRNDALVEVERLETKVELYRKALADIGTWEQKSQDWVVETDNGLGMWRGCIAVANMTLEKGGDAIDGRESVFPEGYVENEN